MSYLLSVFSFIAQPAVELAESIVVSARRPNQRPPRKGEECSCSAWTWGLRRQKAESCLMLCFSWRNSELFLAVWRKDTRQWRPVVLPESSTVPPFHWLKCPMHSARSYNQPLTWRLAPGSACPKSSGNSGLPDHPETHPKRQKGPALMWNPSCRGHLEILHLSLEFLKPIRNAPKWPESIAQSSFHRPH